MLVVVELLGGRARGERSPISAAERAADRRSTAWALGYLPTTERNRRHGGVDKVALVAAQEALDPHAFGAEQEYVGPTRRPSSFSRRVHACFDVRSLTAC